MSHLYYSSHPGQCSLPIIVRKNDGILGIIHLIVYIPNSKRKLSDALVGSVGEKARPKIANKKEPKRTTEHYDETS